jgi:hypothetical protein
MSEHVYLIQTRECCRIDKNVYKIGRSNGICCRMKQYPKDSIIHLIVSVEDSKKLETSLLKYFLEKFEKAYLPSGDAYGNEYFRGNINSMKFEFFKHITENSAYFESMLNMQNSKYAETTSDAEERLEEERELEEKRLEEEREREEKRKAIEYNESNIKRVLDIEHVKNKLNKLKRTILKKYIITKCKSDRISEAELMNVYGDDFLDDRPCACEVLELFIYNKNKKIIGCLDESYESTNYIERGAGAFMNMCGSNIFEGYDRTVETICYLKRRHSPSLIAPIECDVQDVEDVMCRFYKKFNVKLSVNGICYQGCGKFKSTCCCKDVQITPHVLSEIQSACDTICELYTYDKDAKTKRNSYGFKHELQWFRQLAGHKDGGYLSNPTTIIALMLLGIEVEHTKDDGPNVEFKTLYPIINNLPVKHGPYQMWSSKHSTL